MYRCELDHKEGWQKDKGSLSHVRLLVTPKTIQPAKLFCLWNSPGKNPGVGCHYILQGIFPTQQLNLGLPHCRQILLPSEPRGKPKEGWEQKNWCFQIVVLEKTLESPLDCKDIKPANAKGNQPEYSLEVLLLKLKLQYFGHLMQRADSLEKTLLLEKIEDWRRRGWQKMRLLDYWLNGHEFEPIPGDKGGQGSLKCCSPWGHRVGHYLATEQPQPISGSFL